MSSLRVADADEDVGAPAENLFIDGTAWVSGTAQRPSLQGGFVVEGVFFTASKAFCDSVSWRAP